VLHIAVRDGNEEMIDFLISKGIHIDIRGQSNETPLLYACRTQKWNSAYKLISHKADLNITLSGGEFDRYAPLHLAVVQNNSVAFNKLLEAGADMYLNGETRHSAENYSVTTAWDLICHAKNIQLLKDILAHGFSLTNEGSHFTGEQAFSAWKSEIAAFTAKPKKILVKVTSLTGSKMAPKDTGIKAKDSEHLGSSDPYLKIFAEDLHGHGTNRTELWKSEVFQATLTASFVKSPVEVHLNTNQKLVFVIWDYDTFTADDFMGAASVSVAPLSYFELKSFSVTLPLSDENPLTGKQEEDIKGTLEVQISFP